MIAMFKYLVFTFILYNSVVAYVGIIPAEEKPPKFADKEGCYVSSLDRVLEFNVPYSPEDGSVCEKYVCQTNSQTHLEGCSARGVAENCEKIPGDKYRPYPDCCERVRCTKPDGTTIEV